MTIMSIETTGVSESMAELIDKLSENKEFNEALQKEMANIDFQEDVRRTLDEAIKAYINLYTVQIVKENVLAILNSKDKMLEVVANLKVTPGSVLK